MAKKNVVTEETNEMMETTVETNETGTEVKEVETQQEVKKENWFKKMKNKAGDFAEKHPKVTKAGKALGLVALGSGLTVLALGASSGDGYEELPEYDDDAVDVTDSVVISDVDSNEEVTE